MGPLLPPTSPPEVLQAQHRLGLLARRQDLGMQQALDLAWKIIDEWSAGGMPLDLGREWIRRLDRIEDHLVSRKIPFEDRHRLAAFPGITVPADMILSPPTVTVGPGELYLATTAELSRRFARIYTARGRQAPLPQRFCRYRERNSRDAPGQVLVVENAEVTTELTPDEALVLSD
ncbi:hypothetical protein [Streptomyces sp. NPDC003863]